MRVAFALHPHQRNDTRVYSVIGKQAHAPFHLSQQMRVQAFCGQFRFAEKSQRRRRIPVCIERGCARSVLNQVKRFVGVVFRKILGKSQFRSEVLVAVFRKFAHACPDRHEVVGRNGLGLVGVARQQNFDVVEAFLVLFKQRRVNVTDNAVSHHVALTCKQYHLGDFGNSGVYFVFAVFAVKRFAAGSATPVLDVTRRKRSRNRRNMFGRMRRRRFGILKIVVAAFAGVQCVTAFRAGRCDHSRFHRVRGNVLFVAARRAFLPVACFVKLRSVVVCTHWRFTILETIPATLALVGCVARCRACGRNYRFRHVVFRYVLFLVAERTFLPVIGFVVLCFVLVVTTFYVACAEQTHYKHKNNGHDDNQPFTLFHCSSSPILSALRCCITLAIILQAQKVNVNIYVDIFCHF